MDSTLRSAQTSPTSTLGDRRGKKFRPLTSHGMPKEPLPGSPRSIRPHRFSSIMSPFPPPTSPPMTPLSPSIQSPPLTAKSFGTFIDSAPSTPAYSPRMGNGWDSSTLMLLSPVSTAPSSPPEPEWEMMTPAKKAKAESRKSKLAPTLTKEIAPGTSLASHPIKPIEEEEDSKENTPPAEDKNGESKPKEEEHAHAAPLKGLATRMKSMLRRKTSVTEKTRKKEKRQKQYEEFDRMEDSHWSEY